MQATFKRDLGELERAFRLASEFARERGLSETATYLLNLAVEEIFTNIVRHGARGGGDIRIALDVAGGELVVEIVERGAEPFDPTRAPEVDVTAPLEARRPGGLGLHMLRKLMDDMTYEYAGGEAHIRMTKRLED
ncbi:MAG: ATP-binding protein [Candidatus Krumholzibacteria bacterium]|nr:ATP-binding protein [Candidatus Krumholzibacteria bacterium]